MDSVVAQLLDPRSLIVNMGFGMVLTVFYFWLIARILPPRSPKRYWTVSLLVIGVMLFLKPVRPPVFGSLVYAIVTLGLPIVLLKGSLFARILTSFMYMIAMTIGELAGAAAWYVATGLGTIDNDAIFAHFPAYIFGVWCVNMVTTGLLMMGVRYLMHRFVPCGLNADDAVELDGVWPTAYIIFVIMQFTVISEAMTFGLMSQAWMFESLMIIGALLVLFALGDLLLFWMINRSVAWTKEQVRAEALEASIASYLHEAEDMQGLLDDTARLRHDVRNHRAVVELICERGEYAQAEAYLTDLKI